MHFDIFEPYTLTFLDRPLLFFWRRPLLVEWPSTQTFDSSLYLKRPSSLYQGRLPWRGHRHDFFFKIVAWTWTQSFPKIVVWTWTWTRSLSKIEAWTWTWTRRETGVQLTLTKNHQATKARNNNLCILVWSGYRSARDENLSPIQFFTINLISKIKVLLGFLVRILPISDEVLPGTDLVYLRGRVIIEWYHVE